MFEREKFPISLTMSAYTDRSTLYIFHFVWLWVCLYLSLSLWTWVCLLPMFNREVARVLTAHWLVAIKKAFIRLSNGFFNLVVPTKTPRSKIHTNYDTAIIINGKVWLEPRNCRAYCIHTKLIENDIWYERDSMENKMKTATLAPEIIQI